MRKKASSLGAVEQAVFTPTGGAQSDIRREFVQAAMFAEVGDLCKLCPLLSFCDPLSPSEDEMTGVVGFETPVTSESAVPSVGLEWD